MLRVDTYPQATPARSARECGRAPALAWGAEGYGPRQAGCYQRIRVFWTTRIGVRWPPEALLPLPDTPLHAKDPVTYPPYGRPPGGPGSSPWPDPFGGGQGQSAPWQDPFGAQPPPWQDPFGGQGQSPTAWPPHPHGAPPPAADPRRKRTLLITLTALAVVVTVATAAVLWGLNSGRTERAPSNTAQPSGAGTTAGPPTGTQATAAPAKPLPPLGPDRPPRDMQMSSLDQAPTGPKWSYSAGTRPHVMGGDAYTVIVGSDNGLMALDATTGKPR
jgi:hypothetical protein